jgi:sec-independent protein translocase protein TatB
MFPFEQFSFEMLVVLALGLMVLGPKDLPIVLRRIGQFVGKMRGMAAEFRASFDELARQSELDDLRKEVEALRSGAHEPLMIGSPATAGSAAQSPVYDYKPFDDAGAGLDNPGFSIPAEATAQTVVEAAPALPAKTPRKRKAAAVEAPVQAPAAAAAKTARKSTGKAAARPRAKAAAKSPRLGSRADAAPSKPRAPNTPTKAGGDGVAKDAAE